MCYIYALCVTFKGEEKRSTLSVSHTHTCIRGGCSSRLPHPSDSVLSPPRRSVWWGAARPASRPRGGWRATCPATSASRAPLGWPARPGWRRSRPPRPAWTAGRSSRTNAGAPYVRTHSRTHTRLRTLALKARRPRYSYNKLRMGQCA